jgi:hypothetical protein
MATEPRAGGIIRHPGGHTIIKYAWGLGIMINNKVEAFALLKALGWLFQMEFEELTYAKTQ